jgi:uncharacterized protein YacL
MNLNEENNTTITFIVSILCYVIFMVFYSIILKTLVWIETAMDGMNVILFIIGYSLLVILSLKALVYLFSKYLKQQPLTIKLIYELTPILMVVALCNFGVNYGYQSYLDSLAQNSVQPNLEFRAKILDIVMPILAFIMFVVKTKRKDTLQN